jgi:hypothetical protein
MKYILCSVLLIYYFFCSGISYELFTPNVINHVESPYNIGLSAERTGVSNIATQDDIKAIQWLKDNANGRKVVGDYNAYCIQHGFIQNHYDGFDRYGSLTNIKEGDLIFLTSWNVRTGKYIEPNGVGTREAYPLPDFSKGFKVLYSADEGKVRTHLDYSKILLKDSSYVRPELKAPFGLTIEQWQKLICDYEIIRDTD